MVERKDYTFFDDDDDDADYDDDDDIVDSCYVSIDHIFELSMANR